MYPLMWKICQMMGYSNQRYQNFDFICRHFWRFQFCDFSAMTQTSYECFGKLVRGALQRWHLAQNSLTYTQGGPLLQYVLTCVYGVRPRSEQIWDMGIFFGTFLATLFIAWHYFGTFRSKCYPCSINIIYMMPFREKGIILLLILVIYHA